MTIVAPVIRRVTSKSVSGRRGMCDEHHRCIRTRVGYGERSAVECLEQKCKLLLFSRHCEKVAVMWPDLGYDLDAMNHKKCIMMTIWTVKSYREHCLP